MDEKIKEGVLKTLRCCKKGNKFVLICLDSLRKKLIFVLNFFLKNLMNSLYFSFLFNKEIYSNKNINNGKIKYKKKNKLIT